MVLSSSILLLTCLNFDVHVTTVVTEEEHDSREEDQEGEVRGDAVRSKDSSGAVLEAVLLLLSQLRGDQLNTVKVKVQQLLSQE